MSPAEKVAEARQAALDQVRGLHVDVDAHERALRDVEQPTLAQLMKHVDRFGGDGVLEAGMHLPDHEWVQLAVYVKQQPRKKGRR